MSQKVAEAAVRAYVQTQAEQGSAVGARKGLAPGATAGPASGVRESVLTGHGDDVVLPDGVRDVPSHEWTEAEFKAVQRQIGLEAAGLSGSGL